MRLRYATTSNRCRSKPLRFWHLIFPPISVESGGYGGVSVRPTSNRTSPAWSQLPNGRIIGGIDVRLDPPQTLLLPIQATFEYSDDELTDDVSFPTRGTVSEATLRPYAFDETAEEWTESGVQLVSHDPEANVLVFQIDSLDGTFVGVGGDFPPPLPLPILPPWGTVALVIVLVFAATFAYSRARSPSG